MGVHESTRISFILVLINFFMMIGFSLYGTLMYGEAENLDPIAPFGISGIVRGSGLAFFCCIGWELVCTLSEEVKHPSRDLPRGILGSLGAVTILYSGVCLTLCAMVPYWAISIGAPIADAFKYHNDKFGYLVISLVCVTVCPPSVLTGLLGPPRMLYKMAKDGLLFECLGKLNSHGAPAFATIICGTLSAMLAGVLEFESLASCCSAVTLFMFVIVCVGILIVRANEACPEPLETKSHLGWSITGFCLASFNFALVLVGSIEVCNIVWYISGFANIVMASLVVHFFQRIERRASPHGVLGESLIAKEHASMITIVGKRKKKEVFLCPLVPFLPLVASWVDIVMMASLGAPGIGGLLFMLISGLIVYFTYSIKNSKLAHP